MSFDTLGLAPALLRALAEQGYTAPTSIQSAAIPVALSGRDLLAGAQTGTGKTAAFALPLLQRLFVGNTSSAPANNKRKPRALILTPTRELAAQVHDSLRGYAKHVRMASTTIFGGMSMGPQIDALRRGVDVLVATPGRLIDHLQQHTAYLGETEIFVLDEADQMLDLGFILPIRKIVAKLPAHRQNLFFSATMPTEIGKLAGELLKDPAKVSVTPAATTVERVEQSLLFVEAQRKRALLAELFAEKALNRV
ncbi:MAG: DEAD/DEAH box helicase, partial [Xanthomonadaceae bacterium]|nr:DEAD/DEAH box helicase [Xanthomonadaceae bacterium]